MAALLLCRACDTYQPAPRSRTLCVKCGLPELTLERDAWPDLTDARDLDPEDRGEGGGGGD